LDLAIEHEQPAAEAVIRKHLDQIAHFTDKDKDKAESK
jgi:hypothetical protein